MGFAKAESPEVTYIATTNELNIEERLDIVPINWVPKQKWDLKSLALRQVQGASSKCSKNSWKSRMTRLLTEVQTYHMARKVQHGHFRSQHVNPANIHKTHHQRALQKKNSSQNSLKEQWCDISEVVESDFLISPEDIYPNRKVQLEDADIKDSTKIAFEALCEQQHKAFSKNNKDIGCTQLIEMEIDTGDSLPVAQSPYTLPLKHYDWA